MPRILTCLSLILLALPALCGVDIITTVAGGSGYDYTGDGGSATAAFLNGPSGVAVDAQGDMFIADASHNVIRKVDTEGIITTIAGTGYGDFGGEGVDARVATMNGPSGLAIDAVGNLLVVDDFRIRRIDINGIITTVAGNGINAYGGDGGSATAASIYPNSIAVDGQGNIFIADIGNFRVRKVDAAGIITTVAGNGINTYGGDGGSATAASIEPADVAVDGQGNLFIADIQNCRIRKVDANGTITTVAGDGTMSFGAEGVPATSSSLYNPRAVAVDAHGVLYIAEHDRIRKVDQDGVITTVAGNSSGDYNGDGNRGGDGFGNFGNGGLATAYAQLFPSALTFDLQGNLLVAESYLVRKIDLWGVIASPATYTVNAGSTFSSVLPATDGGVAPLVFSVTSAPTVGSVAITDPSTGAFTYTAPAIEGGGYGFFSYTAANSHSTAQVAQVTMRINDVPNVHDFDVLLAPGADYADYLHAQDTDGPQGPFFVLVAPPTQATVILDASGQLHLTANANASGSEVLHYTASDGLATSLPGTITLRYTPVVSTASFAVNAGGTVTGVLPGTGQPLTFSITKPPAFGTVTITDATTGAFSYTSSGTAGTDRFSFTAGNGFADAPEAVVTVAVNHIPEPQAQIVAVLPGKTATGSVSALDNDGPQPLVYAVTTQGVAGTATMDATGNFSYAASAGAVGSDSFQWTANDGRATATGAVTVQYVGANALSVVIAGQAAPYQAALGQELDLFVFGGKAPYTLSSTTAVILPDGNLISGINLNGATVASQHAAAIPLVVGTDIVVITDADGATLTLPITVTALPATAVAPPSVTVSGSGQTIYTAVCPGTLQGLNSMLASLASPLGAITAYTWDPLAQEFTEVTSASTGLAPSQAFFIATHAALNLSFSGTQAPVPNVIPLQPGWNFVGVPPLQSAGGPLLSHDLNADFTLTDAAGTAITGAQRDAAIGTGAYLWDGGAYGVVTVLQTGRGYWVKNNTTGPGQTLLLSRVASGTGVRAATRTATLTTHDIGTPPTPPGSTGTGGGTAGSIPTYPASGGGGGGGCGLGGGVACILAAMLGLVRIRQRRRAQG